MIVGVVAPYASPTTIAGAFLEEYGPGAFRRQAQAGWEKTAGRPVLGLWSHVVSEPLASTSSGSLTLEERSSGVWYAMTPVPEGRGREALALVARGDVTGSSAGFFIREDRWTTVVAKDGTEVPHREILDAVLLEASVVAWPAYDSATAEPRSAPSPVAMKSQLARMEMSVQLEPRLREMELEAMQQRWRKHDQVRREGRLRELQLGPRRARGRR